MRRLVVIFLLLILPIQVLAESLEDLRTTPNHVLLADVVEAAAASAAVISERPTLPGEAPSHQPVAAHADISDSMNSIGLLYTHRFLSADVWPSHRSIIFQSVYFPVIKPPLI